MAETADQIRNVLERIRDDAQKGADAARQFTGSAVTYGEMRDLRAHQTFHMSPLSIYSRQTVIGFSHRPKE
jgi:hypothetical protein